MDCRSSNTGLFCGILVVIAALVSLILFFVFVARDELFLQVKLGLQDHENSMAYNVTPRSHIAKELMCLSGSDQDSKLSSVTQSHVIAPLKLLSEGNRPPTICWIATWTPRSCCSCHHRCRMSGGEEKNLNSKQVSTL